MKKIPTLFVRTFENHSVKSIENRLNSQELAWVLEGEGEATVKIDGACCAVMDGKFYKRYDAKPDRHGKRKTPPEGCIPCGGPDPVTGHWPHWQPVSKKDPAHRWYLAAKENTNMPLADGTYEAIGPHFQGNPYGLEKDVIVRHGTITVDVERSFEGIQEYLETHEIEGLVFWKYGTPRCKIKRSDFGLPWPVRK